MDHSNAGQRGEPSPANSKQAEAQVPHRPDSVPAARVFLTRLLDGWGLDESLIEDASLLASELMTNAVRHGTGIVRLRIETVDGLLHVAVHDDEDHEPVVNHASPVSAGGRGMWIVESIAHAWGTEVNGDAPGKTVWFELTTVRTGRDG